MGWATCGPLSCSPPAGDAARVPLYVNWRLHAPCTHIPKSLAAEASAAAKRGTALIMALVGQQVQLTGLSSEYNDEIGVAISHDSSRAHARYVVQLQSNGMRLSVKEINLKNLGCPQPQKPSRQPSAVKTLAPPATAAMPAPPTTAAMSKPPTAAKTQAGPSSGTHLGTRCTGIIA